VSGPDGQGCPADGPAGLDPSGAPADRIRRGEQLYRALAEQLPNAAVLVFDPGLCLLVAVGEALMAYGVQASDAEGRPVSDTMPPELYAGLHGLCLAALDGRRGEVEQSSLDGTSHFRVFGSPLRDETGRVWAGLVLAHDVTALRAKERALRQETERLADLAQHDELTGLANRTLFSDRLGHALARAQRDGREVAVVFLDLDRFKNVNDTLGHDAGDGLLRTVADVLRSATGATDTVARLGGDEFAVIVEDIGADGVVARALARIRAAFERPVTVVGEELLVRFSVGVACGPADGATAEELLVAADRAMYRAKDAGGGTDRFFDQGLQRRSRELLRLEAELHHALRRGELVAHYQPAIALASGRVVSAEALVRWNHPTRGLLQPGAFIPLAEQTGLATEITAWMLEQACTQSAAWAAMGLPPLRIAVNSCSDELAGGLLTIVGAALDRAGVPGEALEIEITERFLGGEDDVVADDMLAALKALGVTIALDDFGTGYSSLARLRSFPVDVLKIDRSFVAELDHAPAVADTVIALGRNLGLMVLAEGVETAFQHEWLKAAGCEVASGFLFSRPQPPEVLTPWLLHRAQRPAA
jgi:diguanylate cyclase (GGDEF)-like protein/PAS domain S-box-containing protein